MKNEIVIFENQDMKLEVNMKDETVWLSLEQMAKLFDRDKSVISRHSDLLPPLKKWRLLSLVIQVLPLSNDSWPSHRSFYIASSANIFKPSMAIFSEAL